MSSEQNLTRTPLFINGEPRFADEVLSVADPGKPGRVVGEASAASAGDVEDAIAAAAAAFPAWSGLSGVERAALMADAIRGVGDDRDADAAVLSQENGKIVHEAWVDALVFELRWNLALSHAEEVDAVEVLEPVAGAIPNRTRITYRPMGPVTIIVPFNWPIAILGAALPHALLAGNPVIVKPPVSAPLATARVVQRVAEKLPAGVLQVVTGRDADMSPLIQDERIAKVSFTGSVGGGKRMMEMASRSVTPVTLELGGNDAAVFLEDAVLDEEHLDRLFGAIYDTTGQICMNAKRVLVHRSRMDELVAGLEERLGRVRLGYGLDEGTTMGPLHAASQKAFVEELIREAKDSGADVREFGELPADPELRGGNFVRPAIVVGDDPSLRVVTEEQFGPVIPVIAFDDEDEAVRLANDTWAGLGNSVWTADPAAADRVGSRLRSGYVWVNDHGATRLDLRAPFGGVKQSGIGREQGLHGVRDFQEPHAISTLTA